MTEGKDFFNSWLNMQKQTMNNWMEINKNLTQVFEGHKTKTEDSENVIEDVFNMYSTWVKTGSKAFEDTIKNSPFVSGYFKSFDKADAYMKLFDLWPNLDDNLKKTADVTSELYKNMFDSAKYQEIIDKLFGFTPDNSVKDFYNMTAELIRTWEVPTQEMFKPWADTIKKNMEQMPDFVAGKEEATSQVYSNFFKAFEKTCEKFYKMSAVGKDREKVELIMQTIEKYSSYMTQNIEFKHKIYRTGQKAMQQVLETITEKAKQGAHVKNYDEFFKLWIDTNEQTFNKLFSTDEYAKLQADLLESALETRKKFQEIMELSMENLPVPLRSEMDDLYKTIYDLKKKMRNIEAKMKKYAG